MTPALLLALEPHLQTAQATLGTTTHGPGPGEACPGLARNHPVGRIGGSQPPQSGKIRR